MTVDTTVQEKAIAFPTAAKLMQRARERLVRLAREHGIALRQSYTRLGKRALIMQGATAMPNSTSGPTRPCASSRPYLGRTVRDIRRKTAQEESLRDTFRRPLVAGRAGVDPEAARPLPRSIRSTRPRSNASAKGRRTSRTSRLQVSWRRPIPAPPGGQFVAHVKAFHGHTL